MTNVNPTSIKLLYLLILSCIFSSCGNLNSFQKGSQQIPLTSKNKIKIIKLNCNQDLCENSDSPVHTGAEDILNDYFSSIGVSKARGNEKSDFNVYIVSAFEEKIDHKNPRNLHIIIKNSDGLELSQIGISENFSTPITTEYLIGNQLNELLAQKIASVFLSKPILAKNDLN